MACLVMCEVMMPDGKTRTRPIRARRSWTIQAPGSASSRSTSFIRTASARIPRRRGFPAPQGPYYTGVGYNNVGDVAREIVEEHLDLCLDAGINHEGINAEVAKGQWEFQVFGKGSKRAGRPDVGCSLSPEAPDREVRHRRRMALQTARRTADWNGSGMHANFSTTLHARSRRARPTSRRSWTRSRRIATTTSPFTVRTITCA